MCVPNAAHIAGLAINSALSVGKTVIDSKQQSKNEQYRSQVAINNIKSAQNEALRQTQLGIEKAREEKISGLQKAGALITKNAASGFDAYADSNYINYDDSLNLSFLNAENIQNEYNLKADSYFQKANNYLSNYNASKNSTSKAKSALNSLGNYYKVASNWYSGN